MTTRHDLKHDDIIVTIEDITKKMNNDGAFGAVFRGLLKDGIGNYRDVVVKFGTHQNTRGKVRGAHEMGLLLTQFEREKGIFEKSKLGHHPNICKYITSWMLSENDSL